MSNRHHTSRFNLGRLTTMARDTSSAHSWGADRNRHVLVPTSLSPVARQALLLGLELAAMYSAALTVLHVLRPHHEDRAASWLDAIGLLHDAADVQRSRSARETSAQSATLELIDYVENAASQPLLDAVSWRVVCRPGNVAETIACYASESAADLVILSAKPSRWWLPMMPASVRTIERRCTAQVLVVRSRVPAQSGTESRRTPACLF